MIRALILPGQVQLAVEGFILMALGGLAVNLGQARPHDGVVRLGDNLMLSQERLQRRDLLRGDIDQEIVRALRRELLLPAVQQVAAQHQQQCQQHKRQRKRRQLAEGRPRLAQQAIHRQTHRQRFHRQPAQHAEQHPAQHAAEQRQHHRPGQDRPQQHAAAHQPGEQYHHHRHDNRQVKFQRPDAGHHVPAQDA
ncbi:hypothetical protein D3C76_1149970 [compost metagenome]